MPPPATSQPASRGRQLTPIATVLCVFFVPAISFAHSAEEGTLPPADVHSLLTDWPNEPVSWLAIWLTALLYTLGLSRLWKAAGNGHGIRRWEAVCFGIGWATLGFALVSPLHSLGAFLFSAHMTQHELLMLVAAPLMVLGRPVIPFLHALPRRLSHRLGHASNAPAWRAAWGGLTHPFVAWLVHAVVLWTWHVPALFQATQESEWVHAAQHVCFLGSALLFWWSLLHGHRGPAAYGAATLYLFTTALHSGLLGALLTFSRTVWYPIYGAAPQAWGLSPLEDQALGGLIMWIPACSLYIVAALVLFAKWLRESDARVRWRPVAVLNPEVRHAS